MYSGTGDAGLEDLIGPPYNASSVLALVQLSVDAGVKHTYYVLYQLIAAVLHCRFRQRHLHKRVGCAELEQHTVDIIVTRFVLEPAYAE